jgi:hypothetical protein
MKKTLTEQYRLIKEDKGHKGVFLKEAKKQFPNLIRQGATYNEASKILKQRNIISENFVGIPMVGNPLERKKEGFENAFENFLAEAKSLKDIIKSTKVDGSIEDLEKAVMAKAKKEGLNVTQKEVEDAVEKHADSAMGLFEAKAEEKKVSKEVEEDQANGYDTLDKKDPNNMIFGQIQMGYYCEYKDPKNEGKTDQELLEIVYKNLAKDPIFYTKNGQFGEQDLGYTNEAPSLGEPVEPKGEYKSSGYGKLKEHKRRRRKLIKEEKYSGAIIRKGTSSKAKKDTKIVRQALKDKGIKFTNRGEFGMDFKDADLAQIRKVISGLKVGEFIVSHDEDKSKKPVNEIAIAGGIVSGTGFSHKNYMDYFNLNEDDATNAADRQKELDDIAKKKEEIADIEMFAEDMPSEAPEHMEAVADAVEMAYEAGMSIEEITEFVEQHLGLKMGDY